MRLALDSDDLAPVTSLLASMHATITAALTRIDERINVMAMLTQAQIDALTARLDAATAGIRADIQAIKDAHPDVDVTALEARVAGLEGLDAENPEATPEP
jgi:hypothetical protein